VVTPLHALLARVERVLRCDTEVSLVGAVKVALGHPSDTGMMRLHRAEQQLILSVLEWTEWWSPRYEAEPLPVDEAGKPSVSKWLHTRSSVQIADLVGWRLAQVSATKRSIVRG